MKIDFKTYWKDYLIIALIIVVTVLSITASFYYKKAATPAQLAAGKKILEDPKADIIKTFTDRSGLNHTEINSDQNQITQASLNDTSNHHRKGIIDTISEGLNLANKKQIQELTEEVFNLKALIKLKEGTDSSGVKTLNYADKWLDIHYNPLDSMMDFHYDAKLTAVKFYKNRWLPFLKPLNYIDFYGDDPRLTVNGVKHFTVQVPEPLFGFSADAKSTYLFNSGRLVPSFGAGLRIGKFTFDGREYYSIKNERFQPAVSLSYKFLNL